MRQISDRGRLTTPLVVVLAEAWIALIDLPNDVQLGPVSLGGAMTVATAGALALALLLVTRAPSAPSGRHHGHSATTTVRRATVPVALVVFLGYACTRLIVTPLFDGFQNVAVYALFILGIPVAAAVAPRLSIPRMMNQFRAIAVVVSTIFIATTYVGITLYSDRAFALAALIYLAILVPYPSRGPRHWAPILLVIAAITVSQSRTALVVGLILMLFSAARVRRSNRVLAVVAVLLVLAPVGLFLLTSYAPVRDRFIGGDNAVIGGVQINTSGRVEFWTATLESWGAAPWLGHGPGSAAALINSRWISVGHPHNDYLRILHDFGWIGLTLFVLGMILLLIRVGKRVRTLDRPIDWSALVALVAILSTAVTDNVFVYPFVMLPTAVLVGASLGGQATRAADPPPRRARLRR